MKINLGVVLLLVSGLWPRLNAQDVLPSERDGATRGRETGATDDPADVLTPAEWQKVEAAVNRALEWLARQQQADGSYPTVAKGQPGVTSLCMMAFMAHGHLPGEPKYGQQIERAANYIVRCQKQNGLFAIVGPDGPRIHRGIAHEIGAPIAYNHAISSLALSEFYGLGEAKRTTRIEQAIEKSIEISLLMQQWPKDREIDRGGWRYIDDFDHEDSDLSVTGWQLMFLRSARNAGFDVPDKPIEEAVAYVRRTFSKEHGAFGYAAQTAEPRSRGMAGAGILALANAGFHNAPESERSAAWLLRHDFKKYNEIMHLPPEWPNDRYHYGVFQCCQAMYQLGGRHWQAFFPPVVKTLLANQQPNGSWAAESHHYDAQFGNAYTTALIVLSLGATNEMLPIYQR
jgi:hypothetical protein